jgi:hypothetical protein
MSSLRAAPLAIALVTLPLQTAAGELGHSMAPGETLRDAAEAYYGDASWAPSLALHNEIEEDRGLAGDAQIRIPVADLHRVTDGDTWAGLAQRYWGDAARGGELAELSGKTAIALEPGQEIRIPALIPHRIRSGESLAAVSRRIYGEPEKAGALGRLNQLARPESLAIGQLIQVPVLTLPPPREDALPDDPPIQVPAAPEEDPLPDVGSKADPAPPTLAPSLQAGIDWYRAGRYAEALSVLEVLAADPAWGEPHDRDALLQHLVFVYVAFERDALACETFAALRALRPDFTWDEDQVSPKVIERTSRCTAP